MKIDLKFADPISEVYREKLQTVSENFLAQGITDSENRPQRIEFPGMNEEKLDELLALQFAYDRRYEV